MRYISETRCVFCACVHDDYVVCWRYAHDALLCLLLPSYFSTTQGFRRCSPSDGGQARKPRPDIESAKEVGCVKRSQALVVRCEYPSTEKSLACLLEESFRLYLARILAGPEGKVVSCGR